MKLVFWMQFLSFHHVPPFRHLAAEHDVTFVITDRVPRVRERMGWPIPSTGQAKLIDQPDGRTVRDLLQGNPDTFHLFWGPRGFPTLEPVWREAVRLGARTGMYVEPRPASGAKGHARLWIWRADALRRRSQVQLALGTGELGCKWLRRCWYPNKMIRPFGYFLDPPVDDPPAPREDASEVFRFCFVGQLIHRKGMDVLLKAFAQLPSRPKTELLVVGSGADEEQLRGLASSCYIGDRVKFLGNMPNREAMKVVSGSDALVLPSRFDGWGVVVNEALARGVPVVCSDRCGAADLLRSPSFGAVATSEDPVSFANALLSQSQLGPLTIERRLALKGWARNISAAAAASYFEGLVGEITGGSRPTPPWTLTQPQSEVASR